jgi:hypothetical protein
MAWLYVSCCSRYSLLQPHSDIPSLPSMQNILEWMDNDDDVLAAFQATTSVIIQQRQPKKRGGSTVGRREIHRNRLQGHQQLYNDYFSAEPTYPEETFCCRFRMQRGLFLKIVEDVKNANQYFVQKRDAAGRLGFSPLQKVTAAMRMLAYGCSGDSLDEYLCMSK